MASIGSEKFKACAEKVSVVYSKKVKRKEEEDVVKTKAKRAKKTQDQEEEKEEDGSTSAVKVSSGHHHIDALAKWECLPPKESVWIQGLLHGGSNCTLSTLPCMREELLMPHIVFNTVNSGRGKIIFYANVEHALLCPR